MNNTQKQILFTLAFFIVLGAAVCVFFFYNSSSGTVTVTGNPMEDTVIGSVETPGIVTPVSDEPVSDEPSPAEPETESSETESLQSDAACYSFVTTNRNQILHVRETPSMEGTVIARLAPGTKGYVLEYGPVWSLISTGTVKGYSFNEYLELTEIDPEDIPEEYR